MSYRGPGGVHRPGARPAPREPLSRPRGKPANAPACVEVWSGGTSRSTARVLKGEINVDTAQSGGVNCCAWIDLFAIGDIAIKGDTGGVFALHANQLGLTNSFGGLPPSRPPAISPPPVSPSRPRDTGRQHGWDRHPRGQGQCRPGRRADSRQGRCRCRRGLRNWRDGRGARVQRDPELGEPPRWGPVHWRRSAYGHRVPAGQRGATTSRPVGLPATPPVPCSHSPSVSPPTRPSRRASVLPRRRTCRAMCRCRTACAPPGILRCPSSKARPSRS